MPKARKQLNKTVLPEQLKNGLENLSGYAMDEVKVHYNSEKPNQLEAISYANGSEIHTAIAQEKHLPHEDWHVVQQIKGRIKPTNNLIPKSTINDDCKLEAEADELGKKSLKR